MVATYCQVDQPTRKPGRDSCIWEVMKSADCGFPDWMMDALSISAILDILNQLANFPTIDRN